MISLKYNRILTRVFCATFISAITTSFTCSLYAQVPVSTLAKDVKLASANEMPGSPGTIQSLHSYSTGESKAVNSIANPPIPFEAEPKVLLDMKGYDEEFTRIFTFTNTSSATFTINTVDFEKKDNKFDFVSIGPDADLPLDVAPGQTFTIKVAFHSSERNKIYSDHLLFITEQNKEPIAYPIQALQQPISDMPWNQRAQK